MLPQIRLGLSATWVVVFVLAFGELGVSILVAPPGEATLPIRIYTIIANTPAVVRRRAGAVTDGGRLHALAVLGRRVAAEGTVTANFDQRT